MTTIKTIGLVVLGVIVSVLFSVTMNGGGDLGSVYELTTQNFTTVATEDLTVSDDATVTDDFTVGGTGTTSLTFGKVCMSLTSSTGTAFFAYFSANGTLATTSTSCM